MIYSAYSCWSGIPDLWTVDRHFCPGSGAWWVDVRTGDLQFEQCHEPWQRRRSGQAGKADDSLRQDPEGSKAQVSCERVYGADGLGASMKLVWRARTSVLKETCCVLWRWFGLGILKSLVHNG